jgi:hypothetical protein
MAKTNPDYIFTVSGPVIPVNDLRTVFEVSDDQMLRIDFELPAHVVRDMLLAIAGDVHPKGVK